MFLFIGFYSIALTRGYAQDSVQSKISISIDYLMSNKDAVASRWRSLVKEYRRRPLPYVKDLKSDIQFVFSDTFSYRSISNFDDSLYLYEKANDTGLIFNSEHIIPKCEIYDPYRDQILANTIKEKVQNIDYNFVVGFSKPCGNFIVCSIWHKEFGNRFKIVFGEWLLTLFQFNDDGTLKRVFHKLLVR